MTIKNLQSILLTALIFVGGLKLYANETAFNHQIYVSPDTPTKGLETLNFIDASKEKINNRPNTISNHKLIFVEKNTLFFASEEVWQFVEIIQNFENLTSTHRTFAQHTSKKQKFIPSHKKTTTTEVVCPFDRLSHAWFFKLTIASASSLKRGKQNIFLTATVAYPFEKFYQLDHNHIKILFGRIVIFEAFCPNTHFSRPPPIY